ncbi:F0F1 ATP synthase subunit alpha [Ruoffia tabacinasalis]|uniref:F0F1 ATP synthase subunit alpha n=1 Tax=Ruoffia tabacinasalis TaxID=87458 RepID=UPI003F9A1713
METEKLTTRLRQQIQQFDASHHLEEIGIISFVGDGIARVNGLDNAMNGEMIEFANGTIGMVQNLEKDDIGVIILGEYVDIDEGDLVRRTNRVMQVPVGEALLGRVVNPLGEPLDGNGQIITKKNRPIEAEAPAIMDRESVAEPMQTGIKSIDTLVPVGRGQRELIIGDRKTGKTTLAVDTIINQKDEDVICIYVAIGQKESTVKNLVTTLEHHGAMDHTIVVSASASSMSSLLYLAPYAATAMGEEFMYNGRHVLIIYDDLSKQAAAYREMSLLLKRPPGREAYPGDVFYLHSRLLERSAKLNKEMGGGSMTALPIVETLAGDISAYIPTNVISITDGQIFLDQNLFFSGVRPAIDAGLSVSRVGGSAQLKAMKKVAGTLRLNLASYRELEAFSQFGADLDESTQRRLDQGKLTVEVLKQSTHSPIPVANQVIMLFALTHGYLENIPVDQVKYYEEQLYDYIETTHSDVLKEIVNTGDLPDQESLDNLLSNFGEMFRTMQTVD